MDHASGYVIQQIGLFPHMTVAENIGLLLTLERQPAPLVKERVSELLELVRLPPDTFAGRYPRQLPGGQQQRVGLARALALDPPLLLMDEPFGALDPMLRAELGEEFLHLRSGLGKTIVFVTDLDEAFLLGDRVAVIQGGRVITAGTPGEIILDREVRSVIPTGGTGRYLAYIRVESCMRPLSGLPAIDRDLSANQALAALASLKQPEALVTVDGEPAGVVTVQDLIAADAGVPVIAVAGKSPVLSPGDSLSRAIALLRERDRHYALVRDDTGAKGLFFIVDALGRPGGREQP